MNITNHFKTGCVVSCALLISSVCSPLHAESLKSEYKECYSSVIPVFHKDQTYGGVYYYSFSARKLVPDSSITLDIDVCQDPKVPYKYFYYKQDARKSYKSPSQTGVQTITRSGKPTHRAEDKTLEILNEKTSDASVLKRVNRETIGVSTNQNATYYDDDRGNQVDKLNTITPSSLSDRSSAVFSSSRYHSVLGKKLSIGEVNQTASVNPLADEQYYFQSNLAAPATFTANSCWMIAPISNLDFAIDKDEYLDHPDTYGVKLHRFQNLRVFSLDSKTSGEYCDSPILKQNITAELAAAFGHTHDDAPSIDLHNIIFPPPGGALSSAGDVAEENIFEPIDPVKAENNHLYGLDYAAFSSTIDTLDLVFQQGFEHNSIEEIGLDGNLRYLRISKRERQQPDLYPELAVEEHLDIRANCEQDGWSYSPKFSQKGEFLYFLSVSGINGTGEASDSPSILYKLTLPPEGVPNGSPLECDRLLDPTNTDHRKYFGITNYHIQNYYISSDNRKLTVVYEKEGQSEVHFFRLDTFSGKVQYKHPELISGLGRIYDITEGKNSTGGQDFYVLHSQLNHPTRVSRCRFFESLLTCDNQTQRAALSTQPEVPIQKIDSGVAKQVHRRVSSEKLGIRIAIPTDTPGVKKFEKKNIDTYVLTPSGKLRGTILSIHGGPNDAWNGTFHGREYRLAQLGYKVYMPNPTGSTGYGFAYAGESRHNWDKIVAEIKAIAVQIHLELPKDKSDLFLLGYSFGGYVANMIQANPPLSPKTPLSNKSIISGAIAINPVFNIERFAFSTDQLWFPEFQLGLFGTECFGVEPDNDTCNTAIASQIAALSDEERAKLNVQNPKHLFSELDGTHTPIPTFFILGTYDQRVHFCSNVPEMLGAYKDKRIPFSVQLEKQQLHQFETSTLYDQSQKIDRWITSLSDCDRSNPSQCLITDTLKPPLFTSRQGNILFDNNLDYSNFQSCIGSYLGQN